MAPTTTIARTRYHVRYTFAGAEGSVWKDTLDDAIAAGDELFRNFNRMAKIWIEEVSESGERQIVQE